MTKRMAGKPHAAKRPVQIRATRSAGSIVRNNMRNIVLHLWWSTSTPYRERSYSSGREEQIEIEPEMVEMVETACPPPFLHAILRTCVVINFVVATVGVLHIPVGFWRAPHHFCWAITEYE